MANGDAKTSFLGKGLSKMKGLVTRGSDEPADPLAKYFDSANESGEIKDPDYIVLSKYLSDDKPKVAKKRNESEMYKLMEQIKSSPDDVDYKRIGRLCNIDVEVLDGDKDGFIYQTLMGAVTKVEKKEKDTKMQKKIDDGLKKLPEDLNNLKAQYEILRDNGNDEIAVQLFYKEAMKLLSDDNISKEKYEVAKSLKSVAYGVRQIVGIENTVESKEVFATMKLVDEQHPEFNQKPKENGISKMPGIAVSIPIKGSNNKNNGSNKNNIQPVPEEPTGPPLKMLEGWEIDEEVYAPKELTPEEKYGRYESLIDLRITNAGTENNWNRKDGEEPWDPDHFVDQALDYIDMAEAEKYEEIYKEAIKKVKRYVRKNKSGAEITPIVKREAEVSYMLLSDFAVEGFVDDDFDKFDEYFKDIGNCYECSRKVKVDSPNCPTCHSEFD
ncbi:MAG: hypothetical protein GOV02_04350 [Candidatus Aenigmarchaeota archaeon]|nr:hypothetical protein [Candidatus Aenigmarchaeota archaeon]